MLRFAMRIARYQVQQGRLFVLEEQSHGKIGLSRVLSIMSCVMWCVWISAWLDCMTESGERHMKRTYLLTNSEHIRCR